MKTSQTALEYLSADGKSTIRGLQWRQDHGVKHRAVLQIVHGAVEHVSRYGEFATFLADRGIIVCGADHIGHGFTAVPEAAGAGTAADAGAATTLNTQILTQLADSKIGLMPAKGGSDILIADVHALRQRMSAAYPDLPYLMLGHSMGSFILRLYLARYGDGLAGAVLSGTGQPSSGLSLVGNLFARLTALLRGQDYRSKLLDNIGMGSLNKSVRNPKTSHDWLSLSEANVCAYLDDPLCGQVFSAGSYVTLTTLTAQMVKPKNAAEVASRCLNMPLLFIAGADDPVGDCGEGVKQALEQYRQAQMSRLEQKIYEGMRHELLNEDTRMQVYGDVWDWIERTIG